MANQVSSDFQGKIISQLLSKFSENKASESQYNTHEENQIPSKTINGISNHLTQFLPNQSNLDIQPYLNYSLENIISNFFDLKISLEIQKEIKFKNQRRIEKTYSHVFEEENSHLRYKKKKILKNKTCLPNWLFSENFKKLRTIFGHKCLDVDVDTEDEYAFAPVFNVCFDKTGTKIITGDDEGIIKVWCAISGNQLLTIKGHKSFINSVEISPDNKYITSCSNDGFLRLWSLEDGKPVAIIKNLYREQMSTLAFYSPIESNDNFYLSSATNQGDVYLYKKEDLCNNYGSFIPNQRYIHMRIYRQDELKYLQESVSCLEFNKHGNLIAGFSKGSTIVWNSVANINLESTIDNSCFDFIKWRPHNKNCHSTVWNHSGTKILTASYDGSVRCWPFHTHNFSENTFQNPEFELYYSEKKLADSKCWATCWSCNDRYVISIFALKEQKVSDEAINEISNTPTNLVIYDTQSQKVIHRISKYSDSLDIDLVTHILESHPYIERIAISIDLIGRIVIWDIELGHPLNIFFENGSHIKRPHIEIRAVDAKFNPDGKSFAVSTNIGSFSIYGYGSKEYYNISPVESFFESDHRQFEMAQDFSIKDVYVHEDTWTLPKGKITNYFLEAYNIENNFPKCCEYFHQNSYVLNKNIEFFENDFSLKEAKIIQEIKKKIELSIASNIAKEEILGNDLVPNIPSKSNQTTPARQNPNPNLTPVRNRRRGRQRNIRQTPEFEDGNSEQSNNDDELSNNFDALEEEDDDDDFDEESDEDEKYDASPFIRRNQRPARSTRNRAYQNYNFDDDEDFEETNFSNNKRVRNSRTTQAQNSTRSRLRRSNGDLVTQQERNELIDRRNNPRLEELYKRKSEFDLSNEQERIKRPHLNYEEEDSIVEEKCSRCLIESASMKCSKCAKYFHGTCSKFRGRYHNSNFTCYECIANSMKPSSSNYLSQKNLNREWLDINIQRDFYYIPQVGDEVIYFFQGHEEFLLKYFEFIDYSQYQNQTSFIPSEEFPEILKPSTFIIKNIEYQFPIISSPQITKIPVFMKITLISPCKLIEFVTHFANDNNVETFLIEKKLFEAKKKCLPILSPGGLMKKSNNNHILEEYQFIEFSPYDEVFYNSEWKNIKVRSIAASQGISQRRANTSFEKISFWNIQFLVQLEGEDLYIESGPVKIFPKETELQEKLVNILKEFIENEFDLAKEFISEVDKKIYRDYIDVIPFEIYLNKIIERINNGFYRNRESLNQDIEIMISNAETFNGNCDFCQQSRQMFEKMNEIIISFDSKDFNLVKYFLTNKPKTRSRANPDSHFIINAENRMNNQQNTTTTNSLSKNIYDECNMDHLKRRTRNSSNETFLSRDMQSDIISKREGQIGRSIESDENIDNNDRRTTRARSRKNN